MPGMRTTRTDEHGTILEDRLDYMDWDGIRYMRGNLLAMTDTFMLVDRYNALTTEQQTELVNLRASLRSLPQDQADRELSAITMPTVPQWIRDAIEPVVDWNLWDDQQSTEYAADHPDE